MIPVFAALYAVLIAASIIGYTLHLRNPSLATINLNARIKSWWVMITIGGLILLAGTNAVIALFAALSYLALKEFLNPLPLSPFCWAAWIIQYVAITAHWPIVFIVAIPILALITGDRTRATGQFLCIYGLSHAPALLLLDFQENLIFYFVLIVQVSDVLQFIFGKLLGHHPIAPRISPSKTVEGFAGGIIAATLLGAFLFRLTPFNPFKATVLSLAITLAGFLSGLLFSALKRQRNIKDWGQSIAGHGGILDRIDSLCLSAPVCYYTVQWLA